MSDARDLDTAAATSPHPYPTPLAPSRMREHVARLRQHRRWYFRWGFLVLTPGIVLFCIPTAGLLPYSVVELLFPSTEPPRPPLFVSDPVLATTLLTAGIGLFVLGGLGMLRHARRMHAHHRLLVSYGVPADRTGNPIVGGRYGR